ncbi:hypothetical protein [Mycobacterium avium]|uniref:FtsK domain-containing protein n=1 Tax=Mycobacterium avium subsp. hominissuis TaxID=439334 RepID=A0AAI8X5I6_MYCAV|nr:hypothetical protein [Mycobacterium avium]BBN50883.1 hypothetical protein JPH1_53580 [Mycobacterium avium subsp. hominissuis]
MASKSNEARKQAAWTYLQRIPDKKVTYPEALRIVSQKDYRQPLTAIISDDDERKYLRLELEEERLGGYGPHVGVCGPTASGKTNVLAVMASSMLDAPPSRGVHVMVRTSHPDRFDDRAVVIPPGDLDQHLDQLVTSRSAWLRAHGCADARSLAAPFELPAVVVMVDRPDWLPCRLSDGIRQVLWHGDRLDVHLVLAWREVKQGLHRLPEPFAWYVSSWISLDGPDAGQGLWHRRVRGWDVSSSIRVPACARLLR